MENEVLIDTWLLFPSNEVVKEGVIAEADHGGVAMFYEKLNSISLEKKTRNSERSKEMTIQPDRQ